MESPNFTISCVITRNEREYYTGDTWDSHSDRACLYTPVQAERKFSELSAKGEGRMAILSVIQDWFFNFDDGEHFVPNLFEAKFYQQNEAERRLQELS